MYVSNLFLKVNYLRPFLILGSKMGLIAPMGSKMGLMAATGSEIGLM